MIKVIFALLPLISILLMLFVLKKSSIFTGSTAILITAAIAISPIYQTSTDVLSIPFIKSFLTTSLVAYILFFGIFLFHLMEKAGAIQKIASFISTSTNDRVYQVLILAFGLSPLIEAVSGFGLAIIVIAPILIALGFHPLQSALIALISLCIIPWGTLAMGTIIGATLADIPLALLGIVSALMCIPIYIYFSFLVVFIGAGKQAVKEKFLSIFFIGLLLGVSVFICNLYGSVELAGIFGSLAVIAASFWMMKRNNKKPFVETPKELIKNLSPYLLLIILLFISRMILPLKSFLSAWTITSPTYNYQFSPLYAPGFFLIIVCIYSIAIFHINRIAILDSINLTIKKCSPVILTTFLYIVVSEMMSQSGMINVLSVAAAQAFGYYFVLLTPVIGAIGGFLTGSNTASNTMFIRLQTATAQQIGISPLLAASAQNVSSSLMTMVNPSRVALSCSVCQIGEWENNIQKKLALVGAGTLLLIVLEIAIIVVFKLNLH
ncbi:L-lactate permease [Lysinibacillus sp. NPDC047702]|uniref:L-lactate permease n=1 Tax=unclassified Lysinibacillus TaxID=2636778 RepID=UPI003D08B89B